MTLLLRQNDEQLRNPTQIQFITIKASIFYSFKSYKSYIIDIILLTKDEVFVFRIITFLSFHIFIFQIAGI